MSNLPLPGYSLHHVNQSADWSVFDVNNTHLRIKGAFWHDTPFERVIKMRNGALARPLGRAHILRRCEERALAHARASAPF